CRARWHAAGGKDRQSVLGRFAGVAACAPVDVQVGTQETGLASAFLDQILHTGGVPFGASPYPFNPVEYISHAVDGRLGNDEGKQLSPPRHSDGLAPVCTFDKLGESLRRFNSSTVRMRTPSLNNLNTTRRLHSSRLKTYSTTEREAHLGLATHN